MTRVPGGAGGGGGGGGTSERLGGGGRRDWCHGYLGEVGEGGVEETGVTGTWDRQGGRRDW